VSVITSGIRRHPPTGWQIYDATRRLASVAALAAASPLEVEFEERSGRPRGQLERAARGVVPPSGR